jgi:hypothetical protein
MILPRLSIRDLLRVTDALMSIDASERTHARLRDALAPATLTESTPWAMLPGAILQTFAGVWLNGND